MEFKTKSGFNFYQYLLNMRPKDKAYLDLLKYEIDKRIYYYGDNFITNYEKFSNIKFHFYFIIKCLFLLKNILKKKTNNPVVISNAYFNFNNELRKLSYEVVFPEITIGNRSNFIGNFKIFFKYEYIKKHLKTENLNIILSDRFQKKIEELKIELKSHFLKHKVVALFIAYDMPFLEKILINIFKEINRPSFVFLHGLPSRYNNIDDNRTNYLLVWGNKMKENYIRAGVDENKVIVIGNPKLLIGNNKTLKNNFENILIITNSISPIPENSDEVILQDRGNSLTYLYSIQNVLIKFGIKSVRFRPHPYENKKWYQKNLDNSFFKLDRENLSSSLQKSSLVIGPTSTVFLDSLLHGVNYIVYEPIIDELTIKGFKLVPPFNKDDNRIVMANDEIELFKVLNEKLSLDISFVHDYLETFDISKIFSLIK